jgi:predicted dehydrogenase
MTNTTNTTSTRATIALVGCAHIHTPGFIHNINRRGTVHVKHVWDHDVARAQKSADQLKDATVTTDLEAIWGDSTVDAVVITSETNRHEPLVLSAAAAKKHLFVEKPLAVGAGDGYTMVDAIEKAGVHFTTGYFLRGDSKILFLKEQIEAGNFGKITNVRASNCHDGALGGWFDGEWRWMADPKQSGVGGFGDLGTHALDILLWYFGTVKHATAQIDNGTARYEGCDETGEGLIRFENGTVAAIAAGWDALSDPATFIISGTEGHAAIINGQLWFQSQKVKGADGSQPMRRAELPNGKPAGLDSFFDVLEGKEGALVTAREAAYRSAVMEAMYQGSNETRWVVPITK